MHFPDFSEAQRYQNMLSLERCVLENLPEPMPKIVFHPKSTQTLPRTVTFRLFFNKDLFPSQYGKIPHFCQNVPFFKSPTKIYKPKVSTATDIDTAQTLFHDANLLGKLPEPMPKFVFHPKSTQTPPRTVTFPIEIAT